MRITKLVAMLALAGALPVAATSYYVATNGNDSASGTSVGTPFKTLQKAASVMVAGDTCFIRGGTYREAVTPANSGNSLSPITYTNYNSESVLISGLDVITNTWTLDTGSIYKVTSNLALDSRNQLFVNGAMAYEARWPNNTGTITYFTTSRPTANGTRSADHLTDFLKDSNLPFANSDDLNGASLWICPGLQYASYVKSVSSYTPSTKTVGYEAVDTNSTSWLSQPVNFYYIFGCKPLLDATNEWWYDATSQMLYFWPPGGANPNTLTVEFKARELAFNLDNRNYISIGGLNLKGCRINAKISSGIKLRNLKCEYVWHDAAGGGEGIYLRGQNCEVTGCEVAFSSASLLVVELSDYARVINNHLHDGCYISQSRALKVMGFNDIASHNTVCDAGGTLVRLDMRTGVFQYNHVFNGAWYMRDCGLMYNNYIDGQNTVLQRNVFHDNLSVSTNQSHAVYFDSGTSDHIFVRNIFYHNQMNGLKINSPFNHLVYNNTSFQTARHAIRYQDFAGSIDMASDRLDGTQVANNLVTCNNITLDPAPQMDRNPYCTRNLDPAVNDPQYLNAVTNDFRIAATSPARNKGVFVAGATDAYEDSAPDIGAYEYGELPRKAGHDFANPPATNLLVLPDLTAFANRNRVINGSFELSAASGWTLGDAGTLFRTNQNSSAGGNVLNGFYSARFGPGVDSAQQTVTGLTRNLRYIATVWAKAEPGETAQFSVSGYGGATLTATSTATSWTPLDLWFTNGPANTSATLQLKKTNNSPDSQYVYMDVCSLKQSPAPLLPVQLDRAFVGAPQIIITNTAQYAIPSGAVAYALLAAPAGASVNANGVVTWQPVAANVPGTYTFTMRAQDTAIPALSTSNTFKVTLTAPNLTCTLSGTNLILQWPVSYIGWMLQRQTNLLAAGLSTNWTDVPGSTNTNQWQIPVQSNSMMFFRLRSP